MSSARGAPSPRAPSPARGRRRLRAVGPAHHLPRLPFVVSTVALVVIGVLGVVVLSVGADQESYAVSNLQQLDQQEQATYTVLRARVDELSAPSRITSIALSQGLAPATNVKVMRWPGSKAPPGAATSPAAPGGYLPAGAVSTWSSGRLDPMKPYLAEP